MTASRQRLWRYTIKCDVPTCSRAVDFTTGGQSMDPEWLRYSQGRTTLGWTYAEVDGQERDYCPDHGADIGRGSEQ